MPMSAVKNFYFIEKSLSVPLQTVTVSNVLFLSKFQTPIVKALANRGHIVADTLLPTQMFPSLPARATFVVVGELREILVRCARAGHRKEKATLRTALRG